MDELAVAHNFRYQICTADIDEKAIRHDNPKQLVQALARAKANAITEKIRSTQPEWLSESSVLITCDQVVVHEDQIREKPHSRQEAEEFIAGYAVSPASTVGSILCTNLGTGESHEAVEICTIHMNPLPKDVLEALLEEGDVMYCAGGLMVEHPLVTPYITRIEGTQDAVMGLGKQTVMELILKAAGEGGAEGVNSQV
jgi:septum formation protein